MLADLSEALVHTVLGICTVLCVLIIIAIIIYCFRFIPMLQAKLSKKKEQPEEEREPAWTPPEKETYVDVTDDLEIVAVIAAAIAAGTGVEPGSFTVRSIKRRI